MNILPNSLRRKVVLGFLIGMALTLAVAFINWRYLNNLERMISSGEKVSMFFETTLEIRRFEKNYFLYGKEVDLASLVRFVESAEEILAKNGPELRMFADEQEVADVLSDIKQYRGLLKTPRKPVQGGVNKWEMEIRRKGKAIVTIAEGMSKNERRIMQATLTSTRKSLFMSIVFITGTWIAGGMLFYRMFVRPLGRLEKHMKRVARGEFIALPDESRDREILSLNSAFNRMLLEIEWRQSHLIQSEKLASLGTLLFGVAHELNNPLSNISTSCQILSEEINEPDLDYKKELLGQIETETDRAKEIVRSLLGYSRAGVREGSGLKEIVEESIKFVRGETPAKVAIEINIPEDITVFADRQRLQQVFINLLKNSFDAMPDGGTVGVSSRKINDGLVEMEVSDTGSGMEAEVAKKIFDPFFTMKEKKSGYGLGLFIVHSIIKEHGGSIDVDSAPGGGTTFFIILPEKEPVKT